MGNKITYLASLLLIILVFVSCGDKNSFVIKGSIKGLENADLYVVTTVDSALRLDTIRSKGGRFTYIGESETLEPVVIYMENGSTWITVWAQNGEKYSLSGYAKYPELIAVKGGETNQLLMDFKTANKDILKERGNLRDKILDNSKNPNELSTEINETQLSLQIKNIDQILKAQAEDFVETHPASVASLVLIQDYIFEIDDVTEIQPFLSLITGPAKENTLYEKLEQRCLKYLQTELGKPALDFSIPGLKKDTIRLETFKEKYLVINFAASWCTECEKEYSGLHEIKGMFPKGKVEILTISLDENKDAWIELAEEKQIDWTQANDNAGWDSKIVSLYNVSAIPCNYLIDKEGIIIGSKLPADSIQSILNGLLKPSVKN
jgi:peroxiredoxin